MAILDAISKPLPNLPAIDSPRKSLFDKIAEPIGQIVTGAAQQTLKGLGIIGDVVDYASGTPGKAVGIAMGKPDAVPFRFSKQVEGATTGLTGSKTAGAVAGFGALLAEPLGLPGKAGKAARTAEDALSLFKNAGTVKSGMSITGKAQEVVQLSKTKGEKLLPKLGFEQQPNKNFWKFGDSYVHFNTQDKTWHVSGVATKPATARDFIAGLNKETSGKITAETKAKVLSGQAEHLRLPAGETKTVYRVGTKDKVAGDAVTDSLANAKAYLKNRPGASLFKSDVASSDLVKGARNGEYVYAPKSEAPLQPAEAAVPPPKEPPPPAKETPFSVPENPVPGSVESAVAKLAKVISEAKPMTKDIAAEQAAARSERIGKIVSEGYGKGGGKAAYTSALGKLKGELTSKNRFEPVESKLTPAEVDSLFSKIETAPHYLLYERLSIQQGLADLLRGRIPEPQQLSHLEDIFGTDVIRAIQKQLSSGKLLYNNIVDLLNLPRTLITSFDFSAPLRQGIMATVRHPIIANKAFREMFRQAFSPKNFEQWLDELKASADYQVMKRSGLYIADPRSLAGGLTTREESFMSRWAERFPGIKASQRAYLGYLNKLRVDVFRDMSKSFAEQGAGSPKDLKALADFVNVTTGRGDLGKLGRIAPELNAVFFSPRLIAARLAWFNPRWYVKQTKAVRIEALKTMFAFVGTGMSILTLARLGGAEVEADPRSVDFGKIKVGNTRWDIWGGFQQWVRVFSQLSPSPDKDGNWSWQGHKKDAKGRIVELSTKEFPFKTRHDVALDFLFGKFAPIPSLVDEMLKGQQMNGGDLTLTDQAVQNAIPLYMQDIWQAYKDGGVAMGLAAGVPSVFGVGLQTYTNKKSSGASLKGGGAGGLPEKTLPSLPKLPPLQSSKLPQLPKLPALPALPPPK